MKTSSKLKENCQVELSVTLDAGEVGEIVKGVERVFLREAQLPGFRKGKVPLPLIRKEFASGLKEEIRRAMLREKYAEAVKAEALDELGLIGLKEATYDEAGGSFVALLETKPKFKLPTYKGLKIESRDAKVSDEQVNEQLERLRVAYAKYEDAKEGEAVGDGDFVQIDYAGTVDGKPILEINPEAKVVAEGKGFWTQVEEGRFLPEILDAVKGMKAGESKEGIKAKFDKEAAPEGLKGAKAVYSLTLKTFRRRILPDDAAFAEKAKAESYEKLVATVRESLEKAAVEQESARRENEAVELLMKKVDFDVPRSQVLRAEEGFLREFEQRAQYSGLDASYFEKNRDKIMKDAEAAATRQVRLWYVLEAIAAAEKIEAKDDELGKKVVEFVLANAKK